MCEADSDTIVVVIQSAFGAQRAQVWHTSGSEEAAAFASAHSCSTESEKIEGEVTNKL